MKNFVLLIILALVSSIAFGQSQQKIGVDRLILGSDSAHNTELDLSGSIIRRNKTSGKAEFSNNGTSFTPFVTAPGINPNYIINGNFNFWQRGVSFTSTSHQYTADRFAILNQGSSTTVTRQSTNLSEDFNANYFFRAAVTSVGGASNSASIVHKLENIISLAGKTVTLSFWAKADSSKSMSIEFIQNFGSGGSPSATVTGLGTKKLSLTTAWQKFTVTVNLPSLDGKVIGSNGNNFTGLVLWFDAGSSFNSRTDSLGQQSGTFDIAQMKLEDGEEATGFILSGGTILGELLACQRFYERGRVHLEGYGLTTLNPSVMVFYKSDKRVVPTVTFTAITSSNTDNTPIIAGGITHTNSFSVKESVSSNAGFYFTVDWVSDAEIY